MADDNALARALRLATMEDMRNPLMHPQEVNQFALPSPEPRAELRNLPPRPGDYFAPVSESLSPTMGAYGLGNALGGAYVHGREGDWKGAAPHLAEILLSMAPIPGMKKGAMPPRVENPIKAYHGSPYDFDRFKNEHIGTGEGAQAFGFGHYFAEHEPVAKGYRDRIAGAKWVDGKGRTVQTNSLVDDIMTEARKDGIGTVPAQELAFSWRDYVDNPGAAPPAIQRVFERYGGIGLENKGKMYEVAIHASPDQFLDWDKPLSQQSEAVRKAFGEAHGDWLRRNGSHVENKPVGEWINMITGAGPRSGDMARDFSQGLAEKGLAGIEYLDQGSRGSGQGTKNRVVFDPTIIEILRKYGLLGPVALGATANALGQVGDQ